MKKAAKPAVVAKRLVFALGAASDLNAAHHGVAIAMKHAIAQELAQHAAAFQEEANIQFIGYAYAAVQLYGFVEHFFR